MIKKSERIILRMALFMGIFLPVAETVRRFEQITDLSQFFSWFDDYILGGVLITAAWMLKKGKPNAISFMIAAWGIGSGALFLSFLGQFQYINSNTGDPGGIFSVWFVLFVKGLILAYMITGMIKSIKVAGKLF